MGAGKFQGVVYSKPPYYRTVRSFSSSVDILYLYNYGRRQVHEVVYSKRPYFRTVSSFLLLLWIYYTCIIMSAGKFHRVVYSKHIVIILPLENLAF